MCFSVGLLALLDLDYCSALVLEKIIAYMLVANFVCSAHIAPCYYRSAATPT